MTIKVMLADDHAVVRRGLRQIIADSGDIEVIGEASDYGELTALMRKAECDVLVLDISMPGKNGIEVLKIVHERLPKLPVLILSMYPEDQYAMRALKAGASGYVTKDSAPEKLVDAIRVLAKGKKYITPELAATLAERLTAPEDLAPHQTLSDREYETLRLIASGKKLSDIAEALALSPKTVSVYRSRLLEKMNLKNNAELTHYALKHGLVE
ncbi:MAG: response regulator transcription factor [Burkholderiales bacterium]|nr:response regulator transcription factor [Burkholderiales bacterium]